MTAASDAGAGAPAAFSTTPRDAGVSSVRGALTACRPLFIAAIALSVAVNLLLLTGPLYMLQVYDRVLMSGSVETLATLTLIVVVAYASLGLIDDARHRLAGRVGLRLERLLGERLVVGAWRARATGAAPRADAGDLLRDLDAYRNFVGGPGLISATDLPFTPAFVAIIFILHPVLGWFAVASVLTLALLAYAANRATKDQMDETQRAARATGQRVAAVSNAGETVKVLGMVGPLANAWTSERDALVSKQTASGDVGGAYRTMSKAARFLIQSLILGLGAYLVIQGEMSAGAIIAASIILGRALAPIDQALAAWRQAGGARIARANIDAALASFDAVRDEPTAELPAIRGEIEFDRASFTVEGAPAPIVSNVSLTIAAGSAVGIIGPSGVGKTTLIRMLVGAAAPTEGVVRIDGADVAQYRSDALGAQIGYLSQDVGLLAGTIRDNIARFHPGRDAEVIAAARAAGAHEMILRLPMGYDTALGDRGAPLSAGQKQRIGLARAMFGDPQLLVLDEPNANLDDAGAAALGDALQAAKARGATVLVVTHRRVALRFVDQLIAMQPDLSVLFGPRDAVLRKLAAQPAQQNVANIDGGRRERKHA